jgi:hypothetical protein
MSAFYRQTRIHQTRNRHEIGLAAQEIREQLHFAKLDDRTNTLSSAVDLFHDLGRMLDELACLIAKELGEDPRPIEGLEPFYRSAEKFAEWAAYRRHVAEALS